MPGSITLLALFAVVSLAHLGAEAMGSQTGRLVTKPLLMPALAWYYAASAAHPDPVLLAALAFGWLGDVFLMIPDPGRTRRYFRWGLVAFLAGHLLYAVVFAAYLPQASRVPAWGWGALVVFVAVGLVGYRLIVPHAGKLRPAIVAYIVVIVLMGASTVLPLGTVNTAGAVTAMVGALLFMGSDTINAYNRFVREIPGERFYTMSTYLGGQFLLVQGYLMF